MLISKIGSTLTQTGMGLGRVKFSSKGPKRGQYAFLVAKCSTCNLNGRVLFQLSFPQTQSLIYLK